MRFTYVDESGTSRGEPHVVVAGVLIHGDEQLVPAEEHLEAIKRRHIPERDWDTFFFHAKDIWSGGKYFRNRDEWPWERRWPILMDLASAAHRCRLPVVWGFREREEIAQIMPHYAEQTRERQDIVAHSTVFIDFVLYLERFMRREHPDEVTFLTVEDRPEVRRTLKELHALMKDGPRLKALEIDVAEFPPNRIRDTPHFADKRECRMLQLADACAFILRGHLRRSNRNEPLYNALFPALALRPKGEVWPIELWPHGPLLPFWEE